MSATEIVGMTMDPDLGSARKNVVTSLLVGYVGCTRTCRQLVWHSFCPSAGFSEVSPSFLKFFLTL